MPRLGPDVAFVLLYPQDFGEGEAFYADVFRYVQELRQVLHDFVDLFGGSRVVPEDGVAENLFLLVEKD